MPPISRLDHMGLLPTGFWSAVDSFVQWSTDLGLPGLAILSFTEAFVQPVPPEALTLPMFIAEQGNPMMIFLIWLVVTLTSVGGAMVGWWLGKVFGRPVADRFINPKHIDRLESLIVRYGDAGIFIAAVSPIPYKVLAWVAGMGEMDYRRFIIAGLWGRGLRFGIQALAIGIWGDELLSALLNPWVWFAFCIASIVILIPAKKWWDGLLDEEE
jgi:membrane protein YqaA with SNARE-associated domain